MWKVKWMCFSWMWVTKNKSPVYKNINTKFEVFQMVIKSSYKTFCKQFSSSSQYSGYSVKLPQLPSLSNPGYFQFCLVFQQVEFSLNKTEQGAAGLRTIRTADSRYIYTTVDISTHLSKWERICIPQHKTYNSPQPPSGKLQPIWQ